MAQALLFAETARDVADGRIIRTTCSLANACRTSLRSVPGDARTANVQHTVARADQTGHPAQ